MAKTHRVAQGEYLQKIAAQYGFTDYNTIWNDPANRTLKEKRKNPNILAPGDLIVIPETKQKEAGKATGATHNFQVPSGRVKIKIVLIDVNRRPVSNAECVLELGGQSQGNQVFRLTSGGDGSIEQEISIRGPHEGTLLVKDPNLPYQTEMGIRIGHLDPADIRSGQVARLNNLGYNAGSLSSEDEMRFKSAVEEFQCDNSLPVNGICNADTQRKLIEKHGC
jgi:N-acetylmuramoyl-L-alanine amidase